MHIASSTSIRSYAVPWSQVSACYFKVSCRRETQRSLATWGYWTRWLPSNIYGTTSQRLEETPIRSHCSDRAQEPPVPRFIWCYLNREVCWSSREISQLFKYEVLEPYKLAKLDHHCPDNKVHVTNMGPTWVLSAPGGPHVGPMDLVIRVCLTPFLWFPMIPLHLCWSNQVIQNSRRDPAKFRVTLIHNYSLLEVNINDIANDCTMDCTVLSTFCWFISGN